MYQSGFYQRNKNKAFRRKKIHIYVYIDRERENERKEREGSGDWLQVIGFWDCRGWPGKSGICRADQEAGNCQVGAEAAVHR